MCNFSDINFVSPLYIPSDSPLGKLAQQINCPICLETYQQPKALPCLHTYCRDCVQRLVNHRTEDQVISCPQCRGDARVEGNNVDNLPTVFFINELIDIHCAMKQASDNVEIACQNCSESKSVAFCQTCDERGLFICTGCAAAHKQMKVFSDHVVISVSDLKQGSLIHLPTNKTPTYSCSKHNGELKKLYCFTCSQLICRDCTLVDHSKDSGHTYDFIKTVATTLKEELKVKVVPIQNACDKVSKAMSQLKTAEQTIANQGGNFAKKIAASFSQLRALLDQHEQLLLRQTKEVFRKNLDMIESQQNSLDMAKSECKSVCEFVKLTAENACDEELVTMKESIDSRLQELHDKLKNVKLTPTETGNVVIGMPSPCKLENLITRQGFVALLEGKDAGATTGERSLFKLRLTDFHDQPSNVTATVATKLSSLVNKSIIPTIVTNKIPSVYEVSYTPNTRGRHQLMVMINNYEVASFQIFVDLPPTSLGTPVRELKSRGTDHAWRISLSADGDIYVTRYTCDHYAHLDRDGSLKRNVKCVENKLARGIAVDSVTGNVYISGNHRLQKYNSCGELVKEAGGANAGNQPGEFYEPNDIRFFKNKVYICDSGNGRVQIFDPDLKYTESFGNKGRKKDEFSWPEDIDFDVDGNAYIVDSHKVCVTVFSPTYQFMKCISLLDESTSVKPLLVLPLSVRIHGDHMYVGDPHLGVSVYCKHTGRLIQRFLEGNQDSSGIGKLVRPVGLEIDVDGYLYVCLWKSNCVSIF